MAEVDADARARQPHRRRAKRVCWRMATPPGARPGATAFAAVVAVVVGARSVAAHPRPG